MKTYHGKRPAGTTYPGPVTATEDGITRPLKQHWKWTGFNWGYFGSGPRHLAFALLADATGDEAVAGKHCMAFKDTAVSKLADEWSLTDQDVRDLLPID